MSDAELAQVAQRRQ